MPQAPALSSNFRSISSTESCSMRASTGVSVVISRVLCFAVPTSARATIVSIASSPSITGSMCRRSTHRADVGLLHPIHLRNPPASHLKQPASASAHPSPVGGHHLCCLACTTLCPGCRKSVSHREVYTGSDPARVVVPALLPRLPETPLLSLRLGRALAEEESLLDVPLVVHAEERHQDRRSGLLPGECQLETHP